MIRFIATSSHPFHAFHPSHSLSYHGSAVMLSIFVCFLFSILKVARWKDLRCLLNDVSEASGSVTSRLVQDVEDQTFLPSALSSSPMLAGLVPTSLLMGFDLCATPITTLEVEGVSSKFCFNAQPALPLCLFKTVLFGIC